MLIKDDVTVDGYTQPGSLANSNPLTVSRASGESIKSSLSGAVKAASKAMAARKDWVLFVMGRVLWFEALAVVQKMAENVNRVDL